MGIFTFLLAVLATYRLSVMLSKERGPGGIFLKLRNWPDPDKNEVIWEGLRCLWCVSVWVAFLVLAFLESTYLVDLPIALLPIVWLAISGAVITIDHFSK